MTTLNFKPLLAYTVEDTSKLQYPLLASVKLDGIRVVILDGVVYSRSMKPIRSKTVQALFGKPEFEGLDAEVLYGPWNAPNVFNVTTQAVMSTNLPEGFLASELRLAVFDCMSEGGDFESRFTLAAELVECYKNPQIICVEHEEVVNEEHLLAFEVQALKEGYEGLMVRDPAGRYKQGRSTAKEGILGKLKRFSQDEGLIIGFEEKMTNTNEAKTNEIGRTQRSQAQEGMVGAGTLGAFIATCDGIQFTCGSGLDDKTRAEVWANRDSYLGKYFTFTHFAVGRKDSFRFPIYKGMRDAEDMS